MASEPRSCDSNGLLIPSVSMARYPEASPEQIASFREHGYLVVTDAVPQEDLDELERHLGPVIANPEKLAYDWAWSADEDRENRSFRILQSSPSFVWPEIIDAAFRKGRPGSPTPATSTAGSARSDALPAQPSARAARRRPERRDL